jgi:hypothetical protein
MFTDVVGELLQINVNKSSKSVSEPNGMFLDIQFIQYHSVESTERRL